MDEEISVPETRISPMKRSLLALARGEPVESVAGSTRLSAGSTAKLAIAEAGMKEEKPTPTYYRPLEGQGSTMEAPQITAQPNASPGEQPTPTAAYQPESEAEGKWGYQQGSEAQGVIPGGGKGDIVPIAAEPDEYVIPRDVVLKKGTDFFDNLVTKAKEELKQAPKKPSKVMPQGYQAGGTVEPTLPQAKPPQVNMMPLHRYTMNELRSDTRPATENTPDINDFTLPMVRRIKAPPPVQQFQFGGVVNPLPDVYKTMINSYLPKAENKLRVGYDAKTTSLPSYQGGGLVDGLTEEERQRRALTNPIGVDLGQYSDALRMPEQMPAPVAPVPAPVPAPPPVESFKALVNSIAERLPSVAWNEGIPSVTLPNVGSPTGKMTIGGPKWGLPSSRTTTPVPTIPPIPVSPATAGTSELAQQTGDIPKLWEYGKWSPDQQLHYARVHTKDPNLQYVPMEQRPENYRGSQFYNPATGNRVRGEWNPNEGQINYPTSNEADFGIKKATLPARKEAGGAKPAGKKVETAPTLDEYLTGKGFSPEVRETMPGQLWGNVGAIVESGEGPAKGYAQGAQGGKPGYYPKPVPQAQTEAIQGNLAAYTKARNEAETEWAKKHPEAAKAHYAPKNVDYEGQIYTPEQWKGKEAEITAGDAQYNMGVLQRTASLPGKVYFDKNGTPHAVENPEAVAAQKVLDLAQKGVITPAQAAHLMSEAGLNEEKKKYYGQETTSKMKHEAGQTGQAWATAKKTLAEIPHLGEKTATDKSLPKDYGEQGLEETPEAYIERMKTIRSGWRGENQTQSGRITHKVKNKKTGNIETVVTDNDGNIISRQ